MFMINFLHWAQECTKTNFFVNILLYLLCILMGRKPLEGVGKVSSEEVGYYFKLCCLVTTLNYFTLYQYYVAASD